MSALIKSANKIIKYLEKYTFPDFDLAREIRWFIKKAPDAIAAEAGTNALLDTINTFQIALHSNDTRIDPTFTSTGLNISTTNPTLLSEFNLDFGCSYPAVGTKIAFDLTGLTSSNINFRWVYVNNSLNYKTITSSWMNETTFISALQDLIFEGITSADSISSYPITPIGYDFTFQIQVKGTSATNSYSFVGVSASGLLTAYTFS